MKNSIATLIMVCASSSLFAQASTFIVNNYTQWKLQGRLEANSVTPGICYPRIASSTGSLNIIVPADPNGTVIYDKYANAASANFPLTQWWVQTSATSPNQPRPVNHTIFYPTSGVSIGTDWTDFYFHTMDDNNVPNAEFPIGDPQWNGCNPTSETYISTGLGDAEWFIITNSSGIKYTFVQVYP